MENQNNEVKKLDNEIIKKLDASVISVLGNKTLQGFQRAQVVATAIGELKLLLTEEYMQPIMNLQGSRLGFRTDKDFNKDRSKGPGYTMDVVKGCLIEAVLMGLQPTGNQFNIIGGNTYPTKEGCGVLLNNFPGLRYDLVCSLPRVNTDKTSAAVDVTINWTINGESQSKVIPIPIKTDQWTSVDAIIGKATRKGRAWLLSVITGVEITDGDVDDTTYKVVETKQVKDKETIELERIKLLISDCDTLDKLMALQEANPTVDNSLFNAQKDVIISNLDKK